MQDWPIVRALHGETVHNLEMHVRHPDGGKDWVALYSAAPVRDALGQARAAVITIADITAYIAVDFAKVAKKRPDDSHPALVAWRDGVAARPSAAA